MVKQLDGALLTLRAKVSPTFGVFLSKLNSTAKAIPIMLIFHFPRSPSTYKINIALFS
jgi:hypothetical protein